MIKIAHLAIDSTDSVLSIAKCEILTPFSLMFDRQNFCRLL